MLTLRSFGCVFISLEVAYSQQSRLTAEYRELKSTIFSHMLKDYETFSIVKPILG